MYEMRSASKLFWLNIAEVRCIIVNYGDEHASYLNKQNVVKGQIKAKADTKHNISSAALLH